MTITIDETQQSDMSHFYQQERKTPSFNYGSGLRETKPCQRPKL